jgi:hypothetical protein
MRKVSLAVRVIALVAIFSVSAIGQQSPTILLYPITSIDLPVEPARLVTPMTLADAAEHNDFPMFDAMFTNASKREATPFAELHSFWKWSLTDPVGAFYGDDVHARLAAEYPDYAQFIADYGIIDSHGRAFYPSAETRAFLLQHALDSRNAVVAEGGVRPSHPAVTIVPRVAREARTVQSPVRATKAPAPKHVVRKVAEHKAAPTVAAAKVAAPIVAHTVPTAPAVEQQAPVQPVVAPVTVTKVAASPVQARPALRKAPPVAHPQPKGNARFDRGLLLILAGLIGLGMLSMVLSAPDEEPAAEHVDPAPMKKTA